MGHGDDAADLGAALAALAPPGVAVAACGPGEEPGPLLGDEVAAMAAAAPVRRRDFTQGRHCARTALAALGRSPVAIPVGAERRPVWPAGVVGSISHADGHAVAVAGPASVWLGLGVDVERAGAVADDDAAVLCTPGERARLGRLTDPAVRAALATTLFGAKECVHKVVQPVTGVVLEPTEAEVEVDGDRWVATLLVAAGRWPAGTTLVGRTAVTGGRSLCLLAVPRWPVATAGRDR